MISPTVKPLVNAMIGSLVNSEGGGGTPPVGGRTFIDLNKTSFGFYTLASPAWTPTSDFSVSCLFAITAITTNFLFTLGKFRCQILGNFILVYPDYSNTSMYHRFPVTININDLNSLVITARVGSSAVPITATLNGVELTPDAVVTGVPIVSGNGYVGYAGTGSGTLKGIIADFNVTDTSGDILPRTWAIGLDSGNAETSEEGLNTLNYGGAITSGLPVREEYSLSGGQWVGNNGTVLTVNY